MHRNPANRTTINKIIRTDKHFSCLYLDFKEDKALILELH